MNRDPQNDFKRTLARALEKMSMVDSAECPSADTLGAWVENALSNEEQKKWSAHFAGCRRCQATLAAFAATDNAFTPPDASLSTRIRTLLHPGWLRPLAATIAGVIVLSVGIKIFPQAQKKAPLLQENRAETWPQTDHAKQLSSDDKETTRPVEELLAESIPQAKKSVATDQAASPSQLPRTFREEAEKVEQPRTPYSALPLKDMSRRKRSALVSADSPDGNVRWQVRNDRQIEKSVDSGKTWEQPFAADRRLFAATSPEPDVCWMVGERGLVLRYVSPEEWSAVSAPSEDDLIAVSAQNRDRATVQNSDGARWSTVDGGRSWYPVLGSP